uniref:Uncharacterized protein n=1 Tax=Chromera velia CCMP2878 TaxID=1169474 RepID=A0A0G4HB79_9ALVE|eukprot:Cvel_25878.t1-p1 / transcript=Cvel_25878.t1 / gene=Cvel_25878 / organism=Chromera_velia_CCMP2878 / gene_product=hypothetical protein / transcript_product=hypothetical protein / location=Cvel_scaffold2988:4076-5818(-) / protein_length=512 / sequence_SO=supercontig / SO=protein_coding / is_pseudo=false
MAPAAKSANDIKQLRAKISSLQSSIDSLQRHAQYFQEASAALQQSMAASFGCGYNGGACGGNWRGRGGGGQGYPTSSSSSQSVPGGNTLRHPNYVGCRQCGSKEHRITQCPDAPRGSGGRNQGNGRGGWSSVSDQKLPPPCVPAIIWEEDHDFSRLSQKLQDVSTSRGVAVDDLNSFAAPGRSFVLPSLEMPGVAATVEVAAHPWVSLFLFGRKASALLDSGAQTSLINIFFFVSAEHEMQTANVSLSALGNNGIPVVGEKCAEFSYESAPEKIFKYPVLVTENLEYDVVLGMDFLRSRSDVSFELFGGERLYMGDLPPFEVWYDDGLKSTKVYAVKRTHMPQWHRSLLQVSIDAPDSSEVLIRKNFPRSHPSLAVPAQLTIVQGGIAVIEVTNISHSKITVGSKIALSFVEPPSHIAAVTAVIAEKRHAGPWNVPTESSKDLPPIDLKKVISDVPQEMKGEYVGLLREFGDLWSRGRFDLGELKVGGKPYEVTIPTETSVPITWQQERIPY